MALNIVKLLEGMVKIGASDLHLKVDQKPVIRLQGVLRPIDHPVVTASDTIEANDVMMPERCRPKLDETGAADYSHALSPMVRFRINAYHQRGNISIAIRTVKCDVPTFASLNMPEVLNKMVEYRFGLVLVTGVTGCGKSSTLAAMISLINATRHEHIITVEDPIEFLYQDDKSLIQQIEIGSDVINFKCALRNTLRQDPDVILLGELRDRETVETAMHCVETGHLVLSTLHTADAKQTVLRILHFFPLDEQPLVNEQIALNLRGVICQRLLKKADGSGRIPAVEIMFSTPIVIKLIREGRYDELQQVFANEEEGMIDFDGSLVKLLKSELITEAEAMTVVHDEAAFRRALAGRKSGGGRQLIR